MRQVEKIDNFFSIGLLTEIHEYIVNLKFGWAQNDAWNSDLRIGSVPIAIADLSPFHDKLFSEVQARIPGVIGLSLPHPMFYACPQLASIGWHEDYYPYSVSVYLNDYWDKQWGGFFLYEEEGQMKAIKPEFNTAVIVPPNVQHSVTPVSHFSPVRRFSIQLFFVE